jgi:hypothetical protein
MDTDKLLKDMLAAAQGVFVEEWPKAADYATMACQTLVASTQHVARLKAAGRITEDEAAYLLRIAARASKAVLLTVEGLTLLTAEAMINAALQVAKEAVNAALGSWKP